MILIVAIATSTWRCWHWFTYFVGCWSIQEFIGEESVLFAKDDGPRVESIANVDGTTKYGVTLWAKRNEIDPDDDGWFTEIRLSVANT